MAGDWMKIEANTPEKEEVLAITAKMGWDDADITVGKLFRLWRWFDQHTVNGNARTVTTALLDRIVGVTGFCESVKEVGWLIVDGDGVTLPKFDRHNGNTAKNRALTAKRVAKHKAESNAKGNDDSVSEALPREEKSKSKNTTAGSRPEYAPEFETAWRLYPKRAGDNPKRRALKAWNARRAEGHTPEEMADGVQRYARFCQATNKIGTEMVKQAATFFGPDKPFNETWHTAPKHVGGFVG